MMGLLRTVHILAVGATVASTIHTDAATRQLGLGSPTATGTVSASPQTNSSNATTTTVFPFEDVYVPATPDHVYAKWSPRESANSKPVARKGHTATLVGEKLIVYGGLDADANRCQGDVLFLDTETLTWSRPTMSGSHPAPLVGHTANLVSQNGDSKIFVLGGRACCVTNCVARSSSWLPHLWILDAVTLHWDLAEMSNPDLFKGREGHSTSESKGFLYIFGGHSDEGVATNNLLRLSTAPNDNGQYELNQVLTAGQGPSARYGHVAAFLSSRYLTVLGGHSGTGGSSLSMDTAYVIDFHHSNGTNVSTWTSRRIHSPDTAPTAQDMTANVLHDGTTLLTFGGCRYPETRCYNSVHALSSTGKEWTWRPITTDGFSPKPREEHTATILPIRNNTKDNNLNKILVWGGCNGHNECYDDVLFMQASDVHDFCDKDECLAHGGQCEQGECKCRANCTLPCPNDCSDHGDCHRGKCMCDPLFSGEDCSLGIKCAADCSHGGKCNLENATCSCPANETQAYWGAGCLNFWNATTVTVHVPATSLSPSGRLVVPATDKTFQVVQARDGKVVVPGSPLVPLPVDCPVRVDQKTNRTLEMAPAFAFVHQEHLYMAGCPTAARVKLASDSKQGALSVHLIMPNDVTIAAGDVLVFENPREVVLVTDIFPTTKEGDVDVTLTLALARPTTMAHEASTFANLGKPSLAPMGLPLIGKEACLCDHGTCDGNMTCACFAGWAGETCGVEVCPSNCTGVTHGTCNGTSGCACQYGYAGEDCSRALGCGNLGRTCGDNALCREIEVATNISSVTIGQCECLPGWGGPYCNVAVCPGNCSSAQGQGQCKDHGRGRMCVCECGFGGDDCSLADSFKKDCSNNGVFFAGVCMCDKGFSGVDCAVHTCHEADDCVHGDCVHGVCLCKHGFTGGACQCQREPTTGKPAHCEVLPTKRATVCRACNNHGTYHRGVCTCDEDWTGTHCEAPKLCPGNCTDRGECHGGVCTCAEGFAGADCGRAECPTGNSTNHTEVECSAVGLCQNRTCFCEPSFSGKACERSSKCLNACNMQGSCSNGACSCDLGFTGKDCSINAVCPATVTTFVGSTGAHISKATECAGHGECIQGKCYCAPTFYGADCSKTLVCEHHCSDHGNCEKGECFCMLGFGGPSCDQPVRCPDDCNRHGVCFLGNCACHPGFAGVACDQAVECSKDCSLHGECVNGACECDPGFYGPACSKQVSASKKTCPHECSVHGECINKKCSCDLGWLGPTCAQEVTCKEDCSNHGVCWHGQCYCNPGFEGESCHVKQQCTQGCANGVCAYGRCFCIAGYTGSNCSVPMDTTGAHLESKCAKDPLTPPCGANGVCIQGDCNCNPGYFGQYCDKVHSSGPCPNGCSDHGTCNHTAVAEQQRCACEDNWERSDCSALTDNAVTELCSACTRPNSHGDCRKGLCLCDVGFSGEHCTDMCPDKCTVNEEGEANGACVHGACVCRPGFSGLSCGIRSAAGLVASNNIEPGTAPHGVTLTTGSSKYVFSLSTVAVVVVLVFLAGLCVLPVLNVVEEKRNLGINKQLLGGTFQGTGSLSKHLDSM